MSEEVEKKEPVVSLMADLTEWSLSDLRRVTIDTSRILGQIEKPRTNLGGTAPPGRAD
jgi:hypothetical protein